MTPENGPYGNSRPCPYCDGAGCDECDQTGRRYRVGFENERGQQIIVSGSGEFDPALKAMFLALADAAGEHMDEICDERIDP